jgi:hypothetical protein
VLLIEASIKLGRHEEEVNITLRSEGLAGIKSMSDVRFFASGRGQGVSGDDREQPLFWGRVLEPEA